MKIPDAILQMGSNQCTDFSEKSMHPSFGTCMDNIMSTDRGQADKRMDRQTVGQTDRQGETNLPPKLHLQVG